MRAALVLAIVATLAVIEVRTAQAFSACGGQTDWALPAASKVPVHPHLVLYADARDVAHRPLPQPIAYINGKEVTAKLTTIAAGPQVIAVIEIDSEKTGRLKIIWSQADFPPPSVTYTIEKQKPVTVVTAKTSRYHVAYHHSTVHELEDGLELATDAKVTRFTVKWRRDANTAWQTLEVPALTRKKRQVAHLGEIGCVSNFFVSMLESGIELELTAILADGSAVPVSGLPTRIVLPKLPADAEQSYPP